MDDFEKMNNDASESFEKASETPESRREDENRTEDMPGENAGEPRYGFNPDGTYRFQSEGVNANAADEPPRRPEAPREGYYPYGSGQNAQGQDPYPYAGTGANGYPYGGQNNAYPYANGQNGYRAGNGGVNAPNGAYPYQNGGYPYANGERGGNYAYNKENNGGKKGSGAKIFGIIAGVLCVLLIIALVFAVVNGKKGDPSRTDPTETEETTLNDSVDELVTEASPESTDKPGAKGELTPKQIYNNISDTSVGILVYGKSDSLASEGTGVLFKEDNNGKFTYIITCAHVIDDVSGGVVVQLADGTEYTAEKVGYDNKTDIGVLRIEANGLKLAEIGNSDTLAVGDKVYAIGNPGGVEFANSFTDGMVSALDRPVNSSSTGYTMECIQHTAAINPGNSGGALVNVFGQVIGINSMKIVDDEYEGMGFSVPSSVFTPIVNEIILHGYVTNRPKLGITYVPASNYNSYGMFVAIKGLPSGCIVIYSMSEDSSLADTEAEVGDMIVAVNGKPMDDASVLSELIENSSVGDKLTLSLVRINKDYSFEEFDVKVTLVEDRGDTSLVEEEPEEETTYGSYDDYFNDFFGNYFDDFFNNYGGGGFGRP